MLKLGHVVHAVHVVIVGVSVLGTVSDNEENRRSRSCDTSLEFVSRCSQECPSVFQLTIKVFPYF